MTKTSHNRSVNLLGTYQLFLILFCLECVVVLIYLLSSPSESSNAILAGFSIRRIFICLTALIMLGGTISLLMDSLKSKRILHFVASRLETPIRNYFVYSIVQSFLFLVLFLCLIYDFYAYFPIASTRLVPLLFNFSDQLALVMGQWAGLFIFWIFLADLKLFILLSLFDKAQQDHGARFALVRWTATIWTVEGFLFLLYIFRDAIAFKVPDPAILLDPMLRVLILAIWLSTWNLLRKYVRGADRFFVLFASISIWLATFSIYMQLAQWLHATETPINNYFNLLAEAFLHGKLFLTNPPSTYDLTLYQGKWFVPFPPFPAFLMLPFIAIWGVQAFNTVTFSIILGACTNVIVFLILHQLLKLGWIQLSKRGILWLVALFSFGTVFWWLASLSQVSFFSQTCTVLFSALAFWFALKKFPPWLVGLTLTAAILARPNVFLLWPALIAITIQLDQDHGKNDWKRILEWGIFSGIPLVLGAAFLLYYNYLRFGNFLDFGYQTVNGWEWLVDRAREYGIFNPHFIPYNLYYMFLAFSYRLITQCSYYLPRGNGMNLFFTTPAIIYLFRKFKVSWWTGGCWFAIILSTTLLSMYHNVGAIQYSYRYLMDFIIPIMMIIAFNAGKKVSFPLKILIVISIIINYYGIISWYHSPC